LIAALDGLFIGENFSAAQAELGKPQAVVFRQMPAFQWKQTSGLVITVLTARDGTITLVDESAAPADQPTGLAEENSRITGLLFNAGDHSTLALDAPATTCKGSFGGDCSLYHYDRNVFLRVDFAPVAGSAGGVVREATLADQSLLQSLHFDQ
jgi:hypothetical protein